MFEITAETKVMRKIQKKYRKAIMKRDTNKMKALQDQAIEAGMCVDKDGLCEDDRCRCRD